MRICTSQIELNPDLERASTFLVAILLAHLVFMRFFIVVDQHLDHGAGAYDQLVLIPSSLS
jgi:hypothetical protein